MLIRKESVKVGVPESPRFDSWTRPTSLQPYIGYKTRHDLTARMLRIDGSLIHARRVMSKDGNPPVWFLLGDI